MLCVTITTVYFFFKLRHQIFDLGGGDGVKGAGWLIHEQDIRLYCQRAGNAKALMLATGEAERRF